MASRRTASYLQIRRLATRSLPEARALQHPSPRAAQSMRFLHLADLHLDTPFTTRSDAVRRELKEAGRIALERAVELALSERVDVLLIAGDLFDGEQLSFHTERFLHQSMARLSSAGVQVVYATGNHDPGGAGGHARRMEWPEGVTLLLDPKPRVVPIHREGELVGRVTGAGHGSAREERDLASTFPRPQGEVPEIALLHTQVLGTPGEAHHDRYAPSHLAQLKASGYDYWALGHIPLRQELAETPPIHYPGNLQGRHPGESGPKGGLLVQVAQNRTQVDFVELAPIRWEVLVMDELDHAHSLADLARLVENRWTQARESDPGTPEAKWILRLNLAGRSPLHRELSDPEEQLQLSQELAIRLDLLDVEIRAEATRPPLAPADHRDRMDVLGEALRILEELTTEDGPSPSRTLGLSEGEMAALGRAKLDPYLRELLQSEEPELLQALLVEGETS